jgi:hypothetical protein
MRCGAYSQRHNPIMQPRKRCDLGKRNLFGYAAKISLTKGGFRKGTLLRADRTATFADGSPIRAPALLVRHHDRSARSFLNWDGGSGQNSRWSIISGNASLELSHGVTARGVEAPVCKRVQKMAYCPASSIGRAAYVRMPRGNGWTCAFRRFVVLLRVPKTGRHFSGSRVESTGLGVGKARALKNVPRERTRLSAAR